jgi:hypothetical protein
MGEMGLLSVKLAASLATADLPVVLLCMRRWCLLRRIVFVTHFRKDPRLLLLVRGLA